jgi:hypothetical protein
MDAKRKFACPVRWFLGLAVADDVFETHTCLADFDDRWIQQGTNSRRIRIKEDKKDIPILRKLIGTKISPTEIMGATSIACYLRDIGRRCGYQDDLTSYAFRRGFANGVEGMRTPSLQILKCC